MSSEKLRNSSIDVLRGIAVLLVLGAHLDGYTDPNKRWVTALLNSWKAGGWQGVDLFFVLSGFLVSGILFKEFILHQKIDVLRFLVRRGFKIYPPYYFFLSLTPILAWYEYSPIGYFTESIFIQNYTYKIWGHTWSLAVEEHFYLLLALTFSLWKPRASSQYSNLPKKILYLCLVVLLIRIITYMLLPFKGITHKFATHLRLDSLAFGVFLSYFYHFNFKDTERMVLKYKKPLYVFGTLACLPGFFFQINQNKYWGPLYYTWLYLGFGGLLISVLFTEIKRNFIHVILLPLRKIGIYSYSIYLWHMPVQYWCAHVIFKFTGYRVTPIEKVLVYITAAVTLGIIMSKIIEIYSLKIRDMYFPSRSYGVSELR